VSLREVAAGLDDATTWFFERARFDFPCTLTIRLAEGRPGARREVVIGDGVKADLMPVRPETGARVIELVFDEVWRHDASREGRERHPEGERIHYATFLTEQPSRAFDHLWADPQMAFDRDEFGLRRWFVWSEDAVFYVIHRGEPQLRVLDEPPDSSLQRGDTFYR
jgi:hypothetical protein